MQRNDMQRPRKSINVISVFLIAFFAALILVLGFFIFDFFKVEKYPSVKYIIGDSEYKISGEDAYSSSGEVLVCFDDIAKLCDMTVTGSNTEKTFFVAAKNQSISFKDKSNTAVVNGKDMFMTSEAVARSGRIYIPLSFVEDYMGGIEIKKDSGTITIVRSEYNASTKDAPVYVDTYFIGGEEPPLTTPDEIERVAPTYTFVADLSAYEQYMCPEDPDAFLILVNRQNKIDENYAPSNLVPITNVRNDGRSESMVETAEKALQAMFIEMEIAGYTDVSVTSGYRSYQKQSSLYNTYVDREMKNGNLSRADAEKIVDTYSALPGTSEHQTGLCCDMHNLSSADVKFAEKEAYTWLVNNCYKFGFVLRFPEGKEDITGYSFEPWHYRFVGRYHASEMHRLGMCLEEYYDYLGLERE